MGKEQELFQACKDGDTETIERLIGKKDAGRLSKCASVYCIVS
jgi:hypothetical protein